MEQLVRTKEMPFLERAFVGKNSRTLNLPPVSMLGLPLPPYPHLAPNLILRANHLQCILPCHTLGGHMCLRVNAHTRCCMSSNGPSKISPPSGFLQRFFRDTQVWWRSSVCRSPFLRVLHLCFIRVVKKAGKRNSRNFHCLYEMPGNAMFPVFN